MWWCMPEGACDNLHGRNRPDRFRNGGLDGRAVAGSLTVGNAKSRFDGPYEALRAERATFAVLCPPRMDPRAATKVRLRCAQYLKEEGK